MKVSPILKKHNSFIQNISEEILGQSEALWVSPEGSRIAYITFNDSKVELVTLREYGSAKDSGAPFKEAIQREKTFRYPKVSYFSFLKSGKICRVMLR